MVGPEVNLRISKNLKIRLLSAVCILPIPILAVWNGSWIFATFVGLLGLFLMCEWNRLIGLGQIKGISYIAPTLMGLSISLIWSSNFRIALLCFFGAIFVNFLVGIRDNCGKFLSFWGSIYIFFPCACVIWIREYPGAGLALMLWLLIVVCATDTGAYFFGKMIGGPRLAPKISPGKTWAGLFGGIICASFFGTLFGVLWFDFPITPSLWKWVGIAILVAGAAQIGDLGESWLKRQLDVKDSGTIIPGHGGLLDRLDGFMVSAPVFTFVILLIDLN